MSGLADFRQVFAIFAILTAALILFPVSSALIAVELFVDARVGDSA